MCIEDAPASRAAEKLALPFKKTVKRRNKELLCDKMVLDVSEKYIDALYYNVMFYSAEWWNTANAVDRDIKI